MRLTLKQLREHIDQALNEMPLMSVQEPTTDSEWDDLKDDEEEFDSYGSFESPDDPAAKKEKRAVQRFYKQKKFVDDAVRLYKNLSMPVYIVPVWTGRYGNEHTRSYSSNSEKAIATLEEYGVSAERAKELAHAADGGAAVFVMLASRLERGQLPTPWMLVHALFDGNRLPNELDRHYNQVFETAEELNSIAYGIATKDGNLEPGAVDEVFKKAFTFASARNKEVNSESDLAAEIMTQAVLTTKGFVYNPIGNKSFDRQLKKMAELVADARSMFEKAYAGKVTLVEVSLEL